MTHDPFDVITSADNRLIKSVRSLRSRGKRETEGAFLVEGVRAVEDALAAGGEVRTILVREDIDWMAPSDAIPLRRVTCALFDAIAATETPQGVLGVFSQPRVPIASTPSPLLLVLDGIGDPGNLGTSLRAAAGAGVTAVILTEGTVDPYNPKVVRAAMGAHFRVPVRWRSDTEALELMAACPQRLIAEASGAQSYDEVDWAIGSALIIGSEAHGPSDTIVRMSTGSVRIPLAGDVESLNAGVAAAVICFEAARQRRKGHAGVGKSA